MLASAFAKKYHVKASVKFVDEVRANDPRANGWPHTLYKVSLNARSVLVAAGKLGFKYRTGIGITEDPRKLDLLYSAASDANAGMLSFSDFCGEFGADEDSITTLATWKACRKFYRKAYDWCVTQEMLDDFLSIEEG